MAWFFSRAGSLAFAVSFLLGIGAAASGAELDRTKLGEIPARLQALVDHQTIAGAVTLVAHQGRVAALDAVGYADLGARKPMRTNALFWIASMTKPITATAVMMLEEAGQLAIDDPVAKYLPEFTNQWLVDQKSAEALSLKKPPRAVTIRDLLTHTSGLAEGPAAGRELTLAELTLLYSQQPLQFAPGSKWQYSNAGINTLGRIVEVVSSKPFADFLSERIFAPLRMEDTTFYPTLEQLERLAKSYEPAKGSSALAETPIFFFKGDLASRARPPYPAGGLFSTAADLGRFYQAVLDDLKLGRKKLLGRQTLSLMTQTQTGDLKTGFTPGMSYGLGWAVVREPAGVTAMLLPGTFGHGGAFGTQGWIDPAQDLILILMIQRAKLPNADDSEVRRVFQQAALDALRD